MGPVLTVDEKFLGRCTVQKIDAEIERLTEAAKSSSAEATK